jgi:hypothetical protein
MKSSAEVEREVEATRGQIDQTVEALKEKMQPKELFEEATRMMGSTSNKVLTTVVEQAKENPIPIALIGAGIAWLALSQTRSRSGYSSYGTPYQTYEGYEEREGLGAKLKSKADRALETAREKLDAARAQAAGRLSQAKDGIGSARTTAAERAGEARGKIAGLTGAAQERASALGRQAQARYEETLQTEPLILAALGVAVGAAIGASLPASRVENRYIGPTRDKLVGKGKELAQTSIDEAKTVAQRAYGQVKEELHRQTGPDGEGASITEKAKALADAGVSTVREEVDSRLAH